MFRKISKKLSIFIVALLIVTNMLGFLTPISVMAEGVYAADLFFSEYIEGSSNNKAIEIYNGTAGEIDLSQYMVELYANGATTPTNKFTLSGTLASGDVYVIANSAAVAAITSIADTTAAVTNFNGDDALVLKHNGVIIDSFGKVGEDPGYYWGTTTDNTLDRTLVRKSSIKAGDATSTDAFDPSVEWDFYAKDEFTKLGSHTMDGFGGGTPAETKVAAVVANPSAGIVEAGTAVILTTTTEGASIFYGIGTAEITTPYTEPIAINEAMTIRAIAKKDGLEDSDVSEFTYTIKAPVEEKTIAEARALPEGSEVIVTGVVTWVDNNSKVYIQDETAAIVVDLYDIPKPWPIFQVGDEITANANLTIYNGLLTVEAKENSDVVKNTSGNQLPEPKALTIPEIKEGAYEAQLAILSGLKLGAINTSGDTFVTDAANNSINIYKIVLPEGVIAGDTINAVAMVSKFNANYQLRIRSANDVTKVQTQDTIAPVITHIPVTAGNTSLDLEISATVTDDRGVQGVAIAYRTVGDAIYTNSAMILKDGQYCYTISKESLSKAGLEYYIEATDGVNTVTMPENINEPYQVTISETDIAAPEITNLVPVKGSSTGVNLRPIMSANYSDASGIEVDSVKFYLDGTEITAECTINEAGVSYTPASDLAQGEHTVRLVVRDKAVPANQADISWSFYAGEKQYNLYFGQLHSHTNISDGQGTLADAYKGAKASGADFFAVTDHSNWFDNDKVNENIIDISQSTSLDWNNMHAAADAANINGSFVAIAGYEMTWSSSTGGWGHINTFNTPWFVSRSNSAMDLKTYYNKIAQNPNSISQLNHPGKAFGDFADFGFYSEAVDNVVHLIEVGNGEGLVGDTGYFPSYEYYTRALDKGWHVAPSNNQDNHKMGWISANDARTVVLASELTREGIFEAIRNNRAYATEDKNLEVMYKVNGNVMGSTLDKPDKLNITIDINDPDENDVIGKVSIISNGGAVAASKTFADNEAEWTLELNPQYSYYYVRIDQEDKDIAVTAPVWTAAVTPVGISKVEVSQDPQIVNQPIRVSATVYNNGTGTIENIKVEFFKNSIQAENKIGEGTIPSVGSGATGTATVGWTSSQVGKFNLYAVTTILVDGVEKVFSSSVSTSFANPEDVIKVVLDRGHYNAYISGDNKNKDLTLREMLKDRKYMLVENNDVLTAEDLEGAQLLIITDPQSTDNTKYSLFKSKFTPEEIAAIKGFTDRGGSLIICSKADYKDGTGEYSNGIQLNSILEAINANLRVNDDEVIDKTSNGGDEYRLYFNTYTSTKYNLTKDIPEGTTYSFFSGASVILKNGGSEEAVDWLVKGHTTTETFDSDTHGDNVPVSKGDVKVIGAEILQSGAKLIVAGSIFFSDFETASVDNAYSNKQITGNILDWMIQEKAVELKTIAEVRADANKDGIPDNLGKRFAIEGRVTAQSEAVTPKNAFFEVIYVQDATGGITVFGVSATPLPLGTKVRITGVVDQFDGDAELSIGNEINDLVVIQEPTQLVEPKVMTTADSMLEANEGWLVKVQGVVTRMTMNSLYIDDGSGEARIYVNGYINDGTDNPDMLGKWDSMIQVGDTVSAIGLASEDPEGHRLRVRNTAEIVRSKDSTPPVITIAGISDGAIYSTDVTPVITVNEGTVSMLLNNIIYNGETITKDGSYTLEVTAVDRDANQSIMKVSFILDKTAPVIASNITDGDVIDKTSKINIINTAEDTLSGVRSLETKLDGVVIPNDYTIESVKLSFGLHHMVITATDKAGNKSIKEIRFTVTMTEESLEDVITRLYEEGKLKNKGMVQSLLSKLQESNMKPFINYVNAQKDKGMSKETADMLIEYANWISAN